MSIVSTSHLITVLTNKSRAFEGQNLLRVIAKKADLGTKDDKGEIVKEYHPNLKETVCVSVPQVGENKIVEHFPGLIVHIRNMLSEAQKEIVKNLILDKAITSVNDAEISVIECVKYLDSQVSGDSFTTEYLNAWFTEYYEQSAFQFCVAVCKFDGDNLTEEQTKAVTGKRNGLKGIFAQFASRKFNPVEGHIKAVRNFAKFVGTNSDTTMARIVAKCDVAQAEIDALTDSFAIG